MAESELPTTSNARFCRRYLDGAQAESRHKKLSEDLVALPGQGEIFFGKPAFVMRGERQRHLVITDVNVGMVIELLRPLGDAIHKGEAVQEVRKLESAADGLRAFRPIGNDFQLNGDFFGGQGWHNLIGFLLAGAGRFGALVILVVVPHPIHPVTLRFIPAERCQVEVVVCADQQVAPASI
jgi:hypothetical protein